MALKEKMQIHSGHRLAYVHTYVNLIIIDLLHFFLLLQMAVCRSLGIPARSVTNFESAHDCDGSISIDSYWEESGEPIEELNKDSVW